MAAGDAFLLTWQFLAAALFLLLAGVLLAIRFNSRVNRAFALFLFMRGMALLLQQLSRLPGYADGHPTGVALVNAARYFVLATPFVLLYFVALYRKTTFGFGARIAGVVALLATIVIELTYLVDHCAYQCPGAEEGLLVPFGQSIPLAEGIAGLVLAVTARQLGDVPRVKPLILVAAALALLGLLEGSQVIATLLNRGKETFTDASFWLAVARAGPLLGFGAAAVAIAVLYPLVHTRGRGLLLGAAVVCVVTTLYYLQLENLQDRADSQALTWTTALFGAWRLLAASVVAYALVRHRFLDLDLRINWTISRGTILAIFIATFLVVSKVIENALNSRLGVIVGGLATGLLMLAIKPLEKLGDKVADGVLPRGRVARMRQEHRVALFREQATLVWADGHMGRKERLLLDNLRERLGLEAGLAMRIEHEAAQQTSNMQNPPALSSRS